MIQGQAYFQGELVHIIDSVIIEGLTSMECQIIYNGPTWVKFDQLSNVTWFVN